MKKVNPKKKLSAQDISQMKEAVEFTLKHYSLNSNWHMMVLSSEEWDAFAIAGDYIENDYNEEDDDEKREEIPASLSQEDAAALSESFKELDKLKEMKAKFSSAEYGRRLRLKDHDVTDAIVTTTPREVLLDVIAGDDVLCTVEDTLREYLDSDFIVFFNEKRISKQSKREKVITAIHEALHFAEIEGKCKIHPSFIDKKAFELADLFLGTCRSATSPTVPGHMIKRRRKEIR